jgi:MoxR-like ATPase
MSDAKPDILVRLERFAESFAAARREMARVVVGQDRAIEQLLVAILAGGNVLLTGVPGLGRTLLVKTLATVLGLTYNRVQFTPDLLPSDIIGTEVLEKMADGSRRFRFFKGPVFCNLLLADEINRSPARTQAALLEAMHERQATIGGQTYWLPKPFAVVATRNSTETEGVWRMPEAQIDRFLAQIELPYPREDDEVELLRRTTGRSRVEPAAVLTPEAVAEMQDTATAVPVTPAVKAFALEIVRASRPTESANVAQPPSAVRFDEDQAFINHTIRLGGSPRAAQALLRAAKVLAIVRGRSYVTRADVTCMAGAALEHRLILDLRAASRGVKMDQVVSRLVKLAQKRFTPEPARAPAARSLLRTADE